ncbi:unnamed protein product [Symbiodinium sp. CCMP2592]|nr:unnamed protein product [Symbiodinium sp. CCMP2592]
MDNFNIRVSTVEQTVEIHVSNTATDRHCAMEESVSKVDVTQDRQRKECAAMITEALQTKVGPALQAAFSQVGAELVNYAVKINTFKHEVRKLKIRTAWTEKDLMYTDRSCQEGPGDEHRLQEVLAPISVLTVPTYDARKKVMDACSRAVVRNWHEVKDEAGHEKDEKDKDDEEKTRADKQDTPSHCKHRSTEGRRHEGRRQRLTAFTERAPLHGLMNAYQRLFSHFKKESLVPNGRPAPWRVSLRMIRMPQKPMMMKVTPPMLARRKATQLPARGRTLVKTVVANGTLFCRCCRAPQTDDSAQSRNSSDRDEQFKLRMMQEGRAMEIAAVNRDARKILTFDGEVQINSDNADAIAAELTHIRADSVQSAERQNAGSERLAEQNRQVAARHHPVPKGPGHTAARPSVSIGYTQAQWDEYCLSRSQQGQYSQAEWDAWNRSRRY